MAGSHRVQPAKLHNLLQNALAHHRAGRLAEAEAVYRLARSGAPRHFDVLHLSGLLAYQQGRVADAVRWLESAHRADPKSAVCQMRYGLALLAANRGADAEKQLRGAVARDPNFHEGWDNLAYCLKSLDRIGEAVACHQRTVELKPDYATGWLNFGFTLAVLGRPIDALTCHERALAIDPNYAMARYGRAQALQHLHRIEEAVADYERFLQLKPQHHEARSCRLFALHYLDLPREKLFEEHLAYGRAIAQAGRGVPAEPRRDPICDRNDMPGTVRPSALPTGGAPDPERKLRVAILSPDLREHSCAYFLEPLLEHLDRTRFEVVLYHDHFREDATSARLRGCAARWRNFVGQPGPVVEEAIRADAPDILIDLAGHTGISNRLPLFARRLAPVQITYLGYPDTTGVPEMDFRFSDEHADPTGDADALATEQLVRFAPTAWCYRPPVDAPTPVVRPVDARRPVTFGCFNALAKMTGATLKLWARVLDAVPDAALVLKGRGLADPAVRQRFEANLARAGVDVSRVRLVERTADTQSHLSCYGEVDIALDTFPYHGTTTTCEALWMGVPVVTLAGDRHMSRVGVSLLNAAQHPEWIARDEIEFVAIAKRLASDRTELARLRENLRSDLAHGPLLDHAAQSQRFGAALRRCWQDWCARRGRFAAVPCAA